MEPSQTWLHQDKLPCFFCEEDDIVRVAAIARDSSGVIQGARLSSIGWCSSPKTAEMEAINESLELARNLASANIIVETDALYVVDALQRKNSSGATAGKRLCVRN